MANSHEFWEQKYANFVRFCNDKGPEFVRPLLAYVNEVKPVVADAPTVAKPDFLRFVALLKLAGLESALRTAHAVVETNDWSDAKVWEQVVLPLFDAASKLQAQLKMQDVEDEQKLKTKLYNWFHNADHGTKFLFTRYLWLWCNYLYPAPVGK